jgi:hypothetical protein
MDLLEPFMYTTHCVSSGLLSESSMYKKRWQQRILTLLIVHITFVSTRFKIQAWTVWLKTQTFSFNHWFNNKNIYSSVSIATRYRLDGPGIESRWGVGRDFPHLSRRGPFLGVKRSGLSVDHPPPSSTEVKERVELYFYSASGPSWPVLG